MSQHTRLKIFWYLPILLLFAFSPFFGAIPERHRPLSWKVLDGDTIEARFRGEKRPERLRLSGIDAPELAQTSKEGIPIGELSKRHLQKIFNGYSLEVEFLGRDIYSRRLVRIFRFKNSGPREDVGVLQLRLGQALVYRFRRPPLNRYLQAQEMAKAQKCGIFNTRGFISPALYRKKRRETLYSLGKKSPSRYPKKKDRPS